jgi:hypothetical protein
VAVASKFPRPRPLWHHRAMNSRAMRLSLAAVALAFFGCKDEEPAPAPTPVAPIERPPVLGPRSLASRVAYDLVLVGEDAVLVWGPPADQGGGLRAARMDAFGTRDGDEVRAYEPPPRQVEQTLAPSVLELSAAVGGGKIAILWVERDGLEMPVRAEIGDASSLAFGAASRLADGVVRGMNYRGHVGVAGASDGSFVGIFRGTDRPCEQGGDAVCASFAVRPIRAEGNTDARVPLAVPAPCRQTIAGIASAGDRFHYALCSEPEGRAAMTVYTIQRQPDYARSDEVLEGCAPVGATIVGDAVWVLGRCGDERRIARFEPGTDPPTTIDMGAAPIRCDEGHPVIPIAEGVEVALTAPQDRLDPLLPVALTELGARAVWTGRSMLLAVALGREVAIHRYECEHGEFMRTDIL